MAAARRSRCLHCGRAITEKPVIKAADAQEYIRDFGACDDDLVWIDGKDKRSLCDTMNYSTEHITEKEWRVASGN